MLEETRRGAENPGAAHGAAAVGGGLLGRSMAALGGFEDRLGVVLFAVLVVVVLIQVIVRFLLYEWVQIAWTDEIGRALLVWASFWGAVIVQREGTHIAVDLLYSRVPGPIQQLLAIASDVLVSAFLLILAWQALPIFLDSFQRMSPASGLPVAIFDGPLWIACVLMLLHTWVNAARRWRPAAADRPAQLPAPGSTR